MRPINGAGFPVVTGTPPEDIPRKDNAAVYDTANTPQWYVTKSSGINPDNPPQVPVNYQAQFERNWHAS